MMVLSRIQYFLSLIDSNIEQSLLSFWSELKDRYFCDIWLLGKLRRILKLLQLARDLSKLGYINGKFQTPVTYPYYLMFLKKRRPK